MKIKSVKSTSEFAREIEALVKTTGVDYMDALVEYSNRNNVEIEVVASMVKNNQTLKAKLQSEAEDLNYLPKSSRLPI